MRNRGPKFDPEKDKSVHGAAPRSMKKQKNISRLGGHGLSLEAFANAKSTTNHYNPALIKQQKEFYKNAKYLSKFKRKLKQQNQQKDVSSAVRLPEDTNGNAEGSETIKRDKKKKQKVSSSLGELYEKHRQEKEKARLEREAIIKEKKEAKEKAEAKRKAERQKMFKRTKRGQPVMKYKIEHLLEVIQGSN